MNDYIEYIVDEKDVGRTIKRISFEDLHKYKDCIDWSFISNYITEETCTKKFYDEFIDYLCWRGSYVFLSYVSEEDLVVNFDRIYNLSNLFYNKRNYSEEFCEKCLNYILEKDESKNKEYVYGTYGYMSSLNGILRTNTNISFDFLEKYLLNIIIKPDTNKHFSNYYYDACNNLVKYQKLTEEQYLKYIKPEKLADRRYFEKFDRFIALSNVRNNFSKEFIKENRENLNTKEFFKTNQVNEYLAINEISKNALEFFKSKIDFVKLINYCASIEKIAYMYPTCKKEFFDIYMKYSDKIRSPKKLSELATLLG